MTKTREKKMPGGNNLRLKPMNPVLHKYTIEELKHVCELKRRRREERLRRMLWRSIRKCPENFGFRFSKQDNRDIFLACCRAYDYMRQSPKRRHTPLYDGWLPAAKQRDDDKS